jgi:hypothetical protein
MWLVTGRSGEEYEVKYDDLIEVTCKLCLKVIAKKKAQIAAKRLAPALGKSSPPKPKSEKSLSLILTSRVIHAFEKKTYGGAKCKCGYDLKGDYVTSLSVSNAYHTATTDLSAINCFECKEAIKSQSKATGETLYEVLIGDEWESMGKGGTAQGAARRACKEFGVPMKNIKAVRLVQVIKTIKPTKTIMFIE